jgi:Xaa-Pro aminopeptidase
MPIFQTVALPGSKIPAEHLKIWRDVRAAQTAAIGVAHEGVIAAEVDKAARASLNNSEYFTHRLGHGQCLDESPLSSVDFPQNAGIGLEVHEDPYLNGGSKTVLETGHAFSNEPGKSEQLWRMCS